MITAGLIENWHIWLVTVTLVVAAVIDGKQAQSPQLDHLSHDRQRLGVQHSPCSAGKGWA